MLRANRSMLWNGPRGASHATLLVLQETTFFQWFSSTAKAGPTAGGVLACIGTAVEFKAEVSDHPRRRIVRLVGRLQGEHTPDLTRLYDESTTPVQLDLGDLDSADAAGLDTLLGLKRRGAELVAVSPYVALQLDSAQARRVENH